MTAGAAVTNGTAVYVYGVVEGDDASDAFDGVRGIDPEHGVFLLREGGLAAVASDVPLVEFGATAIETNLHDPAWLAEKVGRHNAVLEAAVGKTTVLPFRFGAIYVGKDQVREMLVQRQDLVLTLDRLRGKVELGVKAFVDRARVRAELAAERGPAEDEPTSGRAYMQMRQVERELAEAVGRAAAEWSQDAHERLASAADDARMNPPRRPDADTPEEMFLNGAYLVTEERAAEFLAVVDDLRRESEPRGGIYEVTGPWPPYNFVDVQETD